jgi:hypothetical protein
MATQALDRVFTCTYQSNVLNKGQKELEVRLGSKLMTAF